MLEIVRKLRFGELAGLWIRVTQGFTILAKRFEDVYTFHGDKYTQIPKDFTTCLITGKAR